MPGMLQYYKACAALFSLRDSGRKTLLSLYKESRSRLGEMAQWVERWRQEDLGQIPGGRA